MRKEGVKGIPAKGDVPMGEDGTSKGTKVVQSGWSIKLRSQRDEVGRKHRPNNEGPNGPRKEPLKDF